MTEKPRKTEPPLKLDMDFGEALARFAAVDPREVAEGVERSKAKKPPEPKLGRPISSPSPNRRRKPNDGTN